jgi:hypothetical protein
MKMLRCMVFDLARPGNKVLCVLSKSASYISCCDISLILSTVKLDRVSQNSSSTHLLICYCPRIDHREQLLHPCHCDSLQHLHQITPLAEGRHPLPQPESSSCLDCHTPKHHQAFYRPLHAKGSLGLAHQRLLRVYLCL